MLIHLDFNEICTEVAISKLLEPLSPEAAKVCTADNSITNSNGEQVTNQSSEQCKQSRIAIDGP